MNIRSLNNLISICVYDSVNSDGCCSGQGHCNILILGGTRRTLGVDSGSNDNFLVFGWKSAEIEYNNSVSVES